MSDPARYVHIVDDVPELDDLEQRCRCCCTRSTGSSTPATRPALATQHLLDAVLGPGGRQLRHRRLLRLPRAPAADDLHARTATRATSHRGWSSGSTTTASARRTSCCTGRSRTRTGRRSPLAVRAVVEQFGVRLHRLDGRGADGGAAHPTGDADQPRAPSPDLLVTENIWRGQIRVPASAQALLELRLGGWGHPAMGFVAHIPHYVAQFDYPAAAATMLESVEVVTGLQWDLDDARGGRRAKMVEIAAQIEDSAEVRDVVAGLEQQYDAFHRPTPRTGTPCRSRRSRTCPRARSSAPSSSASSPGSTGPTTAGGVDARAQFRRGARQAPRPRDHRRQPVPRHPARHPAPAGVRRPGRRAGRWSPAPAPWTPPLQRALAAQLLPAARRHRRADRVRRRADARRPVVLDPPGGGPPARPADLLHDGELPGARGRASTTRT